MKNKIWLLQLPIILLFTFAFYVVNSGEQGDLHNYFLRERVFPTLKTVNGIFTNSKFRLRGPQDPKNKVVVVEVDSQSIEALGRWPWHRDVIAYLIDKTFEAGAKVVGLDIVFSEPDQRVPEELAAFLNERGMGNMIRQFETDFVLESTIIRNRDRLVLGWATENACQPAYQEYDFCPVTHPEAIATHPSGFEKFAYSKFSIADGFDPQKTPVMSLATFIANLPIYNTVAKHSATFNAFPDPDGYVRRTSLALMANGVPYPTLPLEMARIGLEEELAISINEQGKIQNIQFANSGRNIPVTPLGTMEVNFRGPSFHFPYVSAIEVMGDSDEVEIHQKGGRKIASSKTDILKDAYVLIGVSALGVFDMRAFPFDSNTPGVEGHANILDNLLSGDPMTSGGSGTGMTWMFILMVFGALGFGLLTQRLEAVPALILFIVTVGGFGVFDLKFLFSNNINWNTSLFYLELASIFVFTLAVKYVLEEKNKKFVKGAFAKYVSPAIVDEIMKDPTKLTVGGQKKELTIMFSDVRSFTTISEKMDAKKLSEFLNDYLGLMTEIIFEFKGTLDKYIGDAVMAFWGSPVDDPKHAHNALLAVTKMNRVLVENRPRWKEQFGIDVDAGIGLNSGSVSVGNMGSKRIFSYTVIGDDVNLASRLEGLTKYYGSAIITSRYTLDAVEKAGEKAPAYRTLDNVKVKGKKNAVELIQILDQNFDADGLRVFEEARKLYEKRQWDQAIELFQKSNEKLRASPDTEDVPSTMYIERCEMFKQNPPDADWDGSWEMTSK